MGGYTKGYLSESRIVADDTDFADFWHKLPVCADLTKPSLQHRRRRLKHEERQYPSNRYLPARKI